MNKKILGRREKIALPELGIGLVWAKVDTGAYSSSLHAENIREEKLGKKNVLLFEGLLPGHKGYTGETIIFRKYQKKTIKNSSGDGELRYLIQTTIKIAGEEFLTEFTLSERSRMRNAILLGRKALKNRFLIDVDEVNLAKTYRKESKHINH